MRLGEQYTRAYPHTRAYILMLNQAQQIAAKKEEQHKILLAIVQSLEKALDQIESQIIELSKAPTRARKLGLIKTLVKQREKEQTLQKYKQMLWAMRPLLRRQNAVELVLA